MADAQANCLACAEDSNGGAMFRDHAEPRAGAQPEGSDDDPRGAGESSPLRHEKTATLVAVFSCHVNDDNVGIFTWRVHYCSRGKPIRRVLYFMHGKEDAKSK